MLLLPPLSRCVTMKIYYFFVFFKKKFHPRAKMVKRNDKTHTGEGGKGKKGRTVSDDAGGKSLSDTSTSAGVKSTVIRTSVNIFKSSTIGHSELAKVQEDLYGNKLGMLKQECKTRWSSTHNCGLRASISRWELTTGTLLDSVQLH